MRYIYIYVCAIFLTGPFAVRGGPGQRAARTEVDLVYTASKPFVFSRRRSFVSRGWLSIRPGVDRRPARGDEVGENKSRSVNLGWQRDDIN